MTIAAIALIRPTSISAFEHQAALVCPPSAYAVGIILSVAVPGARQAHQLTDSEISEIFVQVKTPQREWSLQRLTMEWTSTRWVRC